MIFTQKIGKICHKIKSTCRRFTTEVKGIAAVEFALIAPLMILLFLGTVEISYAIALDRKISRTASSIADLITQEFNFISQDAVGQIFSISKEIMQPYDVIPCIVVSGVTIVDGVADVAWSIDNTSNGSETPSANCGEGTVTVDQTARTARTEGDEFPVPAQLMARNNFLVVAEVFLPHSPIVGFVKYEHDEDESARLDINESVINLDDVIYLRPRSGQVIDLEGSGSSS